MVRQKDLNPMRTEFFQNLVGNILFQIHPFGSRIHRLQESFKALSFRTLECSSLSLGAMCDHHGMTRRRG